jgi:hypothetical protein
VFFPPLARQITLTPCRKSTQPQLSLRLRTTFSSSSSSSNSQHILSMLLSISFDPLFREANRAKQHLTLDLLDLASFSSPAIKAATPKDQLPLKAVYKDAVVGVRYLSLEGEEATFKRLQVKFTSVDERKRFVEAVGAFIPSKPAVEPKKLGKGTPTSKATCKTSTAPTPKKKKQVVASTQANPPPSAAPTLPPPVRSTYEAISSASARTNNVNSDFLYQPFPPSFTSDLAQPAPSPFHSAPRHRQLSDASAQPPSRLPRNLTSLLPNLSSTASQAVLSPQTTLTPSQQLARLPSADLDRLLQEVLLEDGFEDLVERVQATLKG